MQVPRRRLRKTVLFGRPHSVSNAASCCVRALREFLLGVGGLRNCPLSPQSGWRCSFSPCTTLRAHAATVPLARAELAVVRVREGARARRHRPPPRRPPSPARCTGWHVSVFHGPDAGRVVLAHGPLARSSHCACAYAAADSSTGLRCISHVVASAVKRSLAVCPRVRSSPVLPRLAGCCSACGE